MPCPPVEAQPIGCCGAHERHYRQLQVQASRAPAAEGSALQWLLALPPSTTPRSKAEIDAELAAERDW